VDVHAAVVGELLPGVAQGSVSVGPQQRGAVGHGRRDLLLESLDGDVDRVLGHHPVGGVLAARDHHQAGDWRHDRVLPGELTARLRLTREERP
jgi:hypothetical protein